MYHFCLTLRLILNLMLTLTLTLPLTLTLGLTLTLLMGAPYRALLGYCLLAVLPARVPYPVLYPKT